MSPDRLTVGSVLEKSEMENSYNKNGVILLGSGDVLGKLVYNKILFGNEHTDHIADGNHSTESVSIENG